MGGLVLGGGEVAVGALGELVATAVTAGAAGTWRSLRISSEIGKEKDISERVGELDVK